MTLKKSHLKTSTRCYTIIISLKQVIHVRDLYNLNKPSFSISVKKILHELNGKLYTNRLVLTNNRSHIIYAKNLFCSSKKHCSLWHVNFNINWFLIALIIFSSSFCVVHYCFRPFVYDRKGSLLLFNKRSVCCFKSYVYKQQIKQNEKYFLSVNILN